MDCSAVQNVADGVAHTLRCVEPDTPLWRTLLSPGLILVSAIIAFIGIRNTRAIARQKATLDAILETQPRFPGARFNRGVLYEEQGQLALARQEGTELSPAADRLAEMARDMLHARAGRIAVHTDARRRPPGIGGATRARGAQP